MTKKQKLKQWTAFIDILGYKDLNDNVSSEDEAKELIEFVNSNDKILEFSNSDAIVQSYSKDPVFNLYDYYDVQHAIVSDSIVISFVPKLIKNGINKKYYELHSANALFILLIRIEKIIFNCFSSKGVFLRGGVSDMFCMIDNKNPVAVGRGLMNAAVVESKIAKYPRVAFDDSVLKEKKIISRVSLLSKLMYNFDSIIKKDPKDGIHFLDVLGFNTMRLEPFVAGARNLFFDNPQSYLAAVKISELFFEKHREAIVHSLRDLTIKLENANDEDEKKPFQNAIKKIEWLKCYHNESIKDHHKFGHYNVA